MKTVLIIAPQFAPSSYPPAQRVRLFSAHLEEHGWKPLVLTVTPDSLEEKPDADFSALVDPSLEVVRVKALPARWTRLAGVGDLGMRSYFPLKKEALRLCGARRVDAVLIPGPPWHPFRIGPALQQERRVPYVLDYIDPWVSSMGEGESFFKKSFWFRQMAIALEPAAVRGASAIIAVSDGINAAIRARYPDTALKPFSAIPYGAEPADFDKIRRSAVPNRVFTPGDGLFHWVYVGSMLPRGVDTLRAIFRAARRLGRPDLRMHFVGTTYAARADSGPVMPIARQEGAESFVTEQAVRAPYAEAVKLLIDSDAVLSFGTTEPFYAASKIYPAMHAGRPHLGVHHADSPVVSILRETRTGECVTYTDASPAPEKLSEIESAMRRIMTAGYRTPSPDAAAVARYSAGEMTRHLAAVLERASAERA